MSLATCPVCGYHGTAGTHICADGEPRVLEPDLPDLSKTPDTAYTVGPEERRAMLRIPSYVKVDSWHIEVDGVQTHTLCGLVVRAHPDPNADEHQATGWAMELPLGDPSCETCLRLFMAEAR